MQMVILKFVCNKRWKKMKCLVFFLCNLMKVSVRNVKQIIKTLKCVCLCHVNGIEIFSRLSLCKDGVYLWASISKE